MSMFVNIIRGLGSPRGDYTLKTQLSLEDWKKQSAPFLNAALSHRVSWYLSTCYGLCDRSNAPLFQNITTHTLPPLTQCAGWVVEGSL